MLLILLILLILPLQVLFVKMPLEHIDSKRQALTFDVPITGVIKRVIPVHIHRGELQQ